MFKNVEDPQAEEIFKFAAVVASIVFLTLIISASLEISKYI
jgi:hypothetical protein